MGEGKTDTSYKCSTNSSKPSVIEGSSWGERENLKDLTIPLSRQED